ncbi:GIY-YIG nuclease family protein [Streptomyces tendae]|uniref:GIY-YIG nuclease family protein n=1 Tax=Streptomyces tendae TaxID=1932 RepID=UPI0036B982FE
MTQIAKRGVVYILSNPSFPSLLKIGQTTRDVSERVRELSRPTSIPEPFDVVWHSIVSDVEKAEREIHAALNHVRVNRFREFFRIEPREAIRIAQRITSQYPVRQDEQSSEVEMLPALDLRMRRWIRSDVVSVKFAQFPDLCILKIVKQPDVTRPVAYESIFDLRCLGGDDHGCDELFCPTHRNIQENVDLFLELDVYSMLMVGIDIIDKDAGDYVAAFWEKQRADPPHGPSWTVVDTAYDVWGSEDKEFIERVERYSAGQSREDLDRLF